MDAVPAPLQGTVVSIDVAPGDVVQPRQQVAVIESMKMEHVVTAVLSGVVVDVVVHVGATVKQGDALVMVEAAAASTGAVDAEAAREIDIGSVRPDLEEVL